jgi:hypothetical protein
MPDETHVVVTLTKTERSALAVVARERGLTVSAAVRQGAWLWLDAQGDPSPGGRASERSEREFARRGRLVALELELERGSLESLQLLLEHRFGEKTIDEVVQEAVRWLLAREARAIVELEAILGRRAEREVREAEAVAYSRAERDRRSETESVQRAIAIARGSKDPPGDVV